MQDEFDNVVKTLAGEIAGFNVHTRTEERDAASGILYGAALITSPNWPYIVLYEEPADSPSDSKRDDTNVRLSMNESGMWVDGPLGRKRIVTAETYLTLEKALDDFPNHVEQHIHSRNK